MKIILDKIKPQYRNNIIDICYRTGYMGEEMGDKNLFADKELFAYLFCLYYVDYAPEDCLVAFDEDAQKVAGYILGEAQSNRTVMRKIWYIGPKIVLLGLKDLLFHYQETGKTLWHFIRQIGKTDEKTWYAQYPAHLHINIAPEYQKQGLGGRLLAAFEEKMRNKKVVGIHLVTSNYNWKAIPFYEKHGYRLLSQQPSFLWPNLTDMQELIFGRKL